MKSKVSLFKVKNVSYLIPFLLVASLFFLWGSAHGLLDILDKHFQTMLHLSKAQSTWIQSALYGGYFFMAIPAGLIVKRFGYKKGIITGLMLFATGAFLFYPATLIRTFTPFLLALLVIACGLTCLETAANPYAVVLGPSESGAARINLAQSANGLGWVLAPLIGGLMILDKPGADQFKLLAPPYIYLGSVVLIVALLFLVSPLPHIKVESEHHELNTNQKIKYSQLLHYPLFIFAAVAQFFYVGGQTGLGSFFINYVTEVVPTMSDSTAAQIVSLCALFPFMLARISAGWIMSFVKPQKLLSLCGIVCMILTGLVMCGFGMFSTCCLCATYFFMAIMFPTIMAIGISNLGELTEKGAAVLVMMVAGGAIVPRLMGYISDISNMQIGFIVPLLCFAVVTAFAFTKVKN